MNIGIVGGGINGLCCAWLMESKGHHVTVYERNTIMSATSRASSKLLHGGLRYLENREFRLVRESLRERDAWLTRVPRLTKPLRITLPIYQQARRSKWQISIGLFLYDHIAGNSVLPKSKWISADAIKEKDPQLNPEGLLGGYEFSDGQMDDYALGVWVAEQAKARGVEIRENAQVTSITTEATLNIGNSCIQHDRLINIAGPWAFDLLERSSLNCPYQLDLIRGSHLILQQSIPQPYLLEVPNEQRIFFVLPWKGKTLVGTTEVRQTLDEPVQCSADEQTYLLKAFQYYFPKEKPIVSSNFSGVRPLLYSATEPSKATREYALHHNGKITTVFGGKWTTAMALAEKISKNIH